MGGRADGTRKPPQPGDGEGTRQEEAFRLRGGNEDPGVFSQENDNKLKSFSTLEGRSFYFIFKFCKIRFKKSLANPLNRVGEKLCSPMEII